MKSYRKSLLSNLILIGFISLNILACQLMLVSPQKIEIAPTPTSMLPDPSITRITHPTPTELLFNPPNLTSPPPDQTSQCANLVFRILPPQKFEKDLFEHHAKGTFLILHLEASNQTDHIVQIFSGDYHLRYSIGLEKFDLTPQAAATNYLYLHHGENFYQDKIAAHATWRTYIAFDVNPKLATWELIIKPGSSYESDSCEFVLYQNES